MRLLKLGRIRGRKRSLLYTYSNQDERQSRHFPKHRRSAALLSRQVVPTFFRTRPTPACHGFAFYAHYSRSCTSHFIFYALPSYLYKDFQMRSEMLFTTPSSNLPFRLTPYPVNAMDTQHEQLYASATVIFDRLNQFL